MMRQAVIDGSSAQDAIDTLEEIVGRRQRLSDELNAVSRLLQIETAGHLQAVLKQANEAKEVALLVFAELEHPTRWESYPRKRRSDRESYSVEECIKLEFAYRETNRGGRVALQARTGMREARIKAYLRARKALEERGALPNSSPTSPAVALPPRGGEPLTAAPARRVEHGRRLARGAAHLGDAGRRARL
jgi:hypothetical protein